MKAKHNFTIPNIFNPGRFDKDLLNAMFAVRIKKFERLFRSIKENSESDEPQDHYIVIGERGMGKTTLLYHLYYKIEDDPDLQLILEPIIFSEEQYGITNLFKLWEEIAKAMEYKDSKYEGVFQEMDDAYELAKNNGYEYERRAFDIIIQALEKKGKKKTLVLFIDNFGDMITRFSEEEIIRFRRILTNGNSLRIIAASPIVSEDFLLYRSPLFDSFKTVQLNGLNREETKKLLLRLGEIYRIEDIKKIVAQQPERIEVLRRLTGGNTRIVVLLFEMLLNHPNTSIITEFIALIDRLTTFYNQKIGDLKGQRREIVNALALNWEAMGAGEIAKKMRATESNAISALLKSMVADEVVERINTGTKNHLYRLKDRFFNIWYLMRYGRREEDKVRWLLIFFEDWLTHYERVERAEVTAREFKKGSFDPYTQSLVGKAFIQLSSLTEYAKKALSEQLQTSKETTKSDAGITSALLLRTHEDVLGKLAPNSEISLDIGKLHNALYESPISLQNKSRIIIAFPTFDQKKAEEIMEFLGKEQQRFEKYAVEVFGSQYSQCKSIKVWPSCAEMFLLENNLELAHLYLQKAKQHDCDIDAKKQVAELYLKIGEKAEAGKDYYQAERSYDSANQFGSAKGAFNLGRVYEGHLSKFAKAETAYLSAEGLGYENLGQLCTRIAWAKRKMPNPDVKGAEFYHLKALEHSKEESSILSILLDIGYLYGYMEGIKDFAMAEEYYLKALKLRAGERQYNSLTWLYYAFAVKKSKAIAYAEKNIRSNDLGYLHTCAVVMLWADRFRESFTIAEKFLYSAQYLNDSQEEPDFLQYFLLLCAKKQYDFLYEYFTSERGKAVSTKDRFRPIYFALMHLMKEKYPLEHLRMGPELQETVDGILAEIQIMTTKYS